MDLWPSGLLAAQEFKEQPGNLIDNGAVNSELTQFSAPTYTPKNRYTPPQEEEEEENKVTIIVIITIRVILLIIRK